MAHQSTPLLWPFDWMISGARYLVKYNFVVYRFLRCCCCCSLLFLAGALGRYNSQPNHLETTGSPSISSNADRYPASATAPDVPEISAAGPALGAQGSRRRKVGTWDPSRVPRAIQGYVRGRTRGKTWWYHRVARAAVA